MNFNINIKGAFKDRTVGFYLGIAGSLVAIVGAIVLIAIDYGDLTFSWAAFLLLIIGGLLELCVVFTDWKFAPLIPAVLIGIGTAVNLHAGIYSIMDIMNGLLFYGGNGKYAIYFTVVFFVGTLLTWLSCFWNQRKVK